jgi:hypothetical protein
MIVGVSETNPQRETGELLLGFALLTPTIMVVATTLEDERNLRVEGGGARLS